jgi:ketosteroid isomerase-like protein
MSIEENKQLVTRTWRTLMRWELDEALESFADDVTWFLTGAMPRVSGRHEGREAVRKLFEGVKAAFPDGFDSEIRRVFGEDETVVVELVNRGTSVRGKPYENEYCFVFELAGGKIRAVREYVDLEKARVALS